MRTQTQQTQSPDNVVCWLIPNQIKTGKNIFEKQGKKGKTLKRTEAQKTYNIVLASILMTSRLLLFLQRKSILPKLWVSGGRKSATF